MIKQTSFVRGNEFTFSMGNLNAKAESDEVVRKYGLGESNLKGDKWVDWCKTNNQVILNTWYKHHPR